MILGNKQMSENSDYTMMSCPLRERHVHWSYPVAASEVSPGPLMVKPPNTVVLHMSPLFPNSFLPYVVN